MKPEMKKKIILVESIRADIMRFHDACVEDGFTVGIAESQHVIDRLPKEVKDGNSCS